MAGGGIRVSLIDVARGLALIAMAVFHFCWDMEMFGLVEPGFMAQPIMIWSGRAIASSFLFLAGVSLFLAHGGKINLPAFMRRWAMVAGAAALITLATWFATPDAFIFFGILHHIALASILGLAFLRFPVLVTAAAGLFIVTMRSTLQTPALDAPWFWWSGLSQFIPRSNDYVPLFPFFGMVLLGVAASKAASGAGMMERLGRWRPTGPLSRLLIFFGRHSLAFYLLHQPIMIGLLYAVLWLSGYI
ncbi:MAG: heparan-alpha-glucosaminide N-acetyltransferase [Rhizobiaceae bacterium]